MQVDLRTADGALIFSDTFGYANSPADFIRDVYLEHLWYRPANKIITEVKKEHEKINGAPFPSRAQPRRRRRTIGAPSPRCALPGLGHGRQYATSARDRLRCGARRTVSTVRRFIVMAPVLGREGNSCEPTAQISGFRSLNILKSEIL